MDGQFFQVFMFGISKVRDVRYIFSHLNLFKCSRTKEWFKMAVVFRIRDKIQVSPQIQVFALRRAELTLSINH